MSACKRDYCTLLAKEDARRFQAKEPSISSIVSGDDDLVELSRALKSRAPRGEIDHLRTVDAWVRRASSIRMPQLALAAERYANGESVTKQSEPETIDMAKAQAAPPVEDVVMEDAGEALEVRGDAAPAASDSVMLDTRRKSDSVSVVSLRDPEAQSVISQMSDAKSAAPKSRVSIAASHQSARSIANSAPPKAETVVSTVSRASKLSVTPSSMKVPPPPPSVVPTPPKETVVPPPPGDDAMSRISIQEPNSRGSAIGTSVSLASVRNLTQSSEDEINAWYHDSASSLEQQFEQGRLRQEQFKRKRALLRADYWTRMDKVRNNATPTIIG